MLRFVVRLRMTSGLLRNISLDFAVVTFRFQIPTFRSLVSFLTSRSSLSVQPLPRLIPFHLRCLDFSRLPMISCHPYCFQPGSLWAAASTALLKVRYITGITYTRVLINCCCKSGHISFLPIPDEPFSPFASLLVGGL